MAKSKKPRGLRIDENLFQSLSENKLVTTAQNYISFLERNYLMHEVGNLSLSKKDYSNKLSEIDPKAGDMQVANKGLHDAVLNSSKNETITRTWIDIPPEQNEEFSKPIKKITTILENENIKKQIEAIRAEILPKHITTPLGKKSWQYDQNKRIETLQKQLK